MIDHTFKTAFVLQKSVGGVAPARQEYGVVYVAQEYPPWQRQALVRLTELYDKVCYIE